MHKSTTVLLLFFILSCDGGDDFKPLKENTDRVLGANAVVRKFNASGYSKREKSWSLVSSEAYMFYESNTTKLFELDLEYYSEEKVATTVEAEEALLDQTKRNLKIEKNVKVVSKNGRRLYTQELNWNEAEQKLKTNKVVLVVYSDSTRIRCLKGMIADKKLEKLVCHQGIMISSQ